MSELSRITETPVPTVKYYLREGLLPPGRRTSPNQAQYDDEHVRRIRLIRALLGPGGLDVATAREVIAAIDSDLPLPHVFGVAQRAASVRVDDRAVDAAALERVDALLDGFAIHPENPGRIAAAAVLEAFDAVGQRNADDWSRRYVEAALIVAEADLDTVERRVTRDEKAETVVVGTALGDALFAALRRAAQEHVSTTRYEPERADEIRRARSTP
ncbi:MerR family transcriptional regulator [Agromyces indicus]|uniref:MerR family transcriptional regulator n=1 Tax=Agromyces indicus TaxID=758919 RepID=A0ABU1FLW3_9MICO|nr:MerR family transcriptional regulator [Agromyces indicus]MDR5692332.1 MerR family transcriptional regulator [Agromyces indicus]